MNQSSCDDTHYPLQLLNVLCTNKDNEKFKLLDELNSNVEAFFSSSPPQNDGCSNNDDDGAGEGIAFKVSKQLQILLFSEVQEKYPFSIENLSRTLQSIKNLLRWYLQTHSLYAEKELVETLQSLPVLTLYYRALVLTTQQEWSEAKKDDLIDVSNVQRFATLCLLYSSFNSKVGCHYVITEFPYMKKSTEMLMKTHHTTVVLATLRLWHSFLVQVPIFKKKFFEYHLDLSQFENASRDPPTNCLAKFQHKMTTMTTVQLLIHILMWCLQHENISESDPKVSEVAIEILRIFYVLKAGPQLDEKLLRELLLTNQDICQVTILILMDLSPTDLVSLVNLNDNNEKTLFEKVLLPTMELQVSLVAEQTMVGPIAASTLTPILVVMQKLCEVSKDFRGRTKEMVLLNTTSQFRKNCLRCLTWTESHVKRCMGELLWTLCEESAQEYKSQVGGIGNAWPILASRGLVRNVPGSY